MLDDTGVAIISLVSLLVTGWFTTRVHRLESRVDELEREQFEDRSYIAKLRDFIYRHNLIPPPRDQEGTNA